MKCLKLSYSFKIISKLYFNTSICVTFASYNTTFIFHRPKENEKIRDELEKAVQIIWNCGLPSPRVSKANKLLLWTSIPIIKIVVSNICNCYINSVLRLMLLLRMAWSLHYKCLFSLRLSSQRQGRFYTVREVISKIEW